MHKKEHPQSHPREHHKPASSNQALEERIIHNLVELQKVHTDLSEKFSKLSSQIEQLLTLFEVSARAFAKQANIQGIEKDKEFLDKIDKLLDQNKLIAKGLTLMEGKMRERLYGQSDTPASSNQTPQNPRSFDAPRPLPRF